VEFTIMPLEDEDGRMTGMAAILHDVTERFDEMKAPRRKFAEVEELARHATSD
jgi:signal transduction histidine kinase